MTTKIGLLSDVHASPAPLQSALDVFSREGVDKILCAGDIAGYGTELVATVNLLVNHHCLCICGNHDQWYLDTTADEIQTTEEQAVTAFLADLPLSYENEFEATRLYMVHAHPPLATRGGIKLLNENGEMLPERIKLWEEQLKDFDKDILIVGHTHQVFCEKIADTLVINPGSSKFNNTCAVLTLPQQQFQVFPVSNKPVQKVWNWGNYEVPK